VDFIFRTLDHFVNVAGIENVTVGTDFDSFADPPDDLKDASQLPELTQRLVAEGHSQDHIDKIWGGDALRVLREGWGKTGFRTASGALGVNANGMYDYPTPLYHWADDETYKSVERLNPRPSFIDCQSTITNLCSWGCQPSAWRS
jgi:hypothetical protein